MKTLSLSLKTVFIKHTTLKIVVFFIFPFELTNSLDENLRAAKKKVEIESENFSLINDASR